ncbi:MAG: hypothetical protein COB24_12895 [Hyphomicrobiales bacterium]|nr:MAG: hypothetical protein COB24_12895 [Hyphomicrobiales bacterium]
MSDKLGKISFKVYGLAHEKNGAVRADVFAKKLGVFLKGLKESDSYLNQTNRLNFLITKMAYGSAELVIEEETIDLQYLPPKSSIYLIKNAIDDIDKGRGFAVGLPIALARSIVDLGRNVEETFAHAEITIDDDDSNVVRIDSFFFKRAEKSFANLKLENHDEVLFEGTTMGTYYGVLRAIDLTGRTGTAKLISNIGGKEISCKCNIEIMEKLANTLNKKVAVSGLIHYSSESRIPKQIDIKKIELMETDNHLKRWIGAFDIPCPDEEDIW